MLLKKKIRYYYWLGIEFSKKNSKLILASFLITFLSFISILTLLPYLINRFITSNQIVSYVGNYDFNNLPDEIATKLSNGLIAVNEKGGILPILASSWEQTNQGLEYRFHLRDNLYWSDGKKFVAADIKNNFADVTSRVIDDKTIYFKLKKTLPIFPTYLKEPILRYPLLGVAGLYKVEKTKVKSGVLKELFLTANKKGLPGIVYKFYDNESQLVLAYKRGEINEFSTSKKSTADIFASWNNSQVTKIVDYNHLMTLFYNFNNQILRQRELRQTISLAINQDQFSEFGRLASGPIAPISWAYQSNIKRQSYDPQLAEKITKKLGISTDSASLNFTTYYDYLDVGDAINNLLLKVGLHSSLSTLSFDKPSSFDLLLALWKVPTDPDQYYFWHSTQTQGNIGNYNNVKVDKLLEDGRSTLSIDERKKYYSDFQKTMLDDPPAFFLFYPYLYTVKRK